MQTERCMNCHYYEAVERAGDGVGVCRRYPPEPQPVQIQTLQGVQMGVQPMLAPVKAATDWCGEFLSGVISINALSGSIGLSGA